MLNPSPHRDRANMGISVGRFSPAFVKNADFRQLGCRKPRSHGHYQAQLSLFWETLQFARLVAVNHPRPVYYDIWLESMPGDQWRVRKASGIVGCKPDIRKWNFSSVDDARKYFDTKIKQKTNPERKSPRKYRIDSVRPHLL